ncbi:hypothetical protein ASPWEDRAFT_43825 [Aspergillus wentii DTO 134E9]|uniref:Suppressor protein SRP40 n=1 Tax=Aspergillus wentii DTO 134E9 TaxID=1073089 RepID=A0A1L9RAE3_ASPWE|nr:uncharacterized protein ASPWEDRAFT_43825 [Aspergillus wentii DTO 134E9]KAI9934416.1 hypothetical protein MW887_000030 [Aspergillus wentii]OJJ31827.1 hypothetical protein ASPWEDRAFT_43825 [Aspergillus wentii DTO 134E9]
MTTATSTTTRLHITPLTPDILPSVLPASIRPLASEISFHAIPTFPENNYGYVTLPNMEADKIKKKLNGSILKGKKFKVEAARPHKRHRDEEGDEEVVPDPKPASEKSSKKSKKRKAEDTVVDGYELPSDRKVKRGWTESSSTKKEKRKEEKKKEKDEKKAKPQPKSKYTEKEECLFRAKLPPNKIAIDKKQEKQSKKKKNPTNESVIHEFANTVTHPSFLRSEGEEATPTSTFEEGKGWVDDSGNVKEAPSDRIRNDQYRPGKVAGAKEKRKSAKISVSEKESKPSKSKGKRSTKNIESSDESEEDWTSSSGSSSDEDTAGSESDEDSTNLSDESSSDDEKDPDPKAGKSSDPTPAAPTQPEASIDQNETSMEADNDSSPKEVHPLEALFKRPAPDSSEKKPAVEAPNAQFSFFGQDDIESEEEEPTKPTEPQTPFTKKDMQFRGLRSAAPTPDTGLVGRNINWNASGEEDAMDMDDEVYTNTPVPKSTTVQREESDFTKWFWENRGDNNRAWKKRRRDAAKEQRQRENRMKGMKGKS